MSWFARLCSVLTETVEVRIRVTAPPWLLGVVSPVGEDTPAGTATLKITVPVPQWLLWLGWVLTVLGVVSGLGPR